jgi:hypothetical protein
MPKAACSNEKFVELFETYGASGMSKLLKMHVRTIYGRRAHIENLLGRKIISPKREEPPAEVPGRLQFDIETGVILIGSDAHFWPGETSTSFKAFLKFCKEFKPAAVIMNGDILDGASISRHPPIGWEHRPTLQQEIETCQDRLGEITKAAGKARRFWPLGNHDSRMESRIASVAPEFAKVHGVHLSDHFADWEGCWSVFVNDNVVVKHRFKGGMHAPHNNTLWAGRTMVTGHLHSQKVQPITDYSGTRWGCDAGTMAETFGPQFTGYVEDNARNWVEGFAMLTFIDGMLLQPELIRVIDKGRVDFRGKVIEV